jgi:hypothetical protein
LGRIPLLRIGLLEVVYKRLQVGRKDYRTAAGTQGDEFYDAVNGFPAGGTGIAIIAKPTRLS